uniref:TERF1-interacting nuclear factor 2 isoform X1 n=1 Tax=Myxine glutinosa TaxID=7769 RepID=UPI00358DF016
MSEEYSLLVWILDFAYRHRMEAVIVDLENHSDHATSDQVPWLRRVGAAVHTAILARRPEAYIRALQLLVAIHEQVPYLLCYRHYMKLVLQLKAKITIDAVHPWRGALNAKMVLGEHFGETPGKDPFARKIDMEKVQRKCRMFSEHIEHLISNKRDRDEYVKTQLALHYDDGFHNNLEKLFWEFLECLEDTLPTTKFDQLLQLHQRMEPQKGDQTNKGFVTRIEEKIPLEFFADLGWKKPSVQDLLRLYLKVYRPSPALCIEPSADAALGLRRSSRLSRNDSTGRGQIGVGMEVNLTGGKKRRKRPGEDLRRPYGVDQAEIGLSKSSFGKQIRICNKPAETCNRSNSVMDTREVARNFQNCACFVPDSESDGGDENPLDFTVSTAPGLQVRNGRKN